MAEPVAQLRTSKFTAALTALAMASATLVAVSSSAQARPEASGVQLNQWCKVTGDTQVMMAAEGIRVVLKKSGVVIVARAPAWKVYEYNPAQHVYCERTVQNVGQDLVKFEAMAFGRGFSGLPLEKSQRTTIAGADAVLYSSPKWFVDQSSKWTEVKAHRLHGESRKADMAVYSGMNLPEQPCRLLKSLYGLPVSMPGAPLQFTYISIHGLNRKRMGTRSVLPCSFRASDFDLPRGYRLVKNEEQVRQTESEAQGLNDMVGGFENLKMNGLR